MLMHWYYATNEESIRGSRGDEAELLLVFAEVMLQLHRYYFFNYVFNVM